MTPTQLLPARARVLLLASSVLFMIGGATHPDSVLDISFEQNTAHMLASEAWVPSHLVSFAGFALLLVALVSARRALPDTARAASTLAIVGTGFMVAELLFHTAAVVDRTNLEAGAATPVLSTHLALAVIGYPIFGIGLAWLAWSLAPWWPPALRIVSGLGILGSLAFGAAAPIVVLSQNQGLAPLFKGAILTAVWMLALAAAGLRADRRETATHPAGTDQLVEEAAPVA
jgi:hypothetical protein